MNMSDIEKSQETAKEETPEKRINYFCHTFYLPRIFMLIACGLAFLLLLFLVLIVTTSSENRFHFQANGLSNAFLSILFLLLLDMVGMCFVHVLSANDMPSYDDFKRGYNNFEDTKKLSRFPELLQYDKDHPTFEKVASDPNLTLKGLCEDFRD